MIDKKIILCILLVLFLVFTATSVYVYKQWKHLPKVVTQKTQAVVPVRLHKKKSRAQQQPQQQQKHANPPQESVAPQPEYQVITLAGTPEPSKPTTPSVQDIAGTCPAFAQPASKPSIVQTVVPLREEPEVLPEPNFECPTFAPRVEKEYVVYADSACRDFNLYPTSQEYYFKFPLPLYNVTSVDIIQAIIPRGEYEVNEYNHIFYVQEPPNAPLPVTLNIGDYITEIALAAHITTQMNAAGLVNTYLVTVSQFKLTFTRTAGVLPFQLMFTNNEYTPDLPEYDPYGLVRQLLGFPPGVIPDVAGVIKAPFLTGQNSIQYVDVVSPDISKNYYDSPEIARIPVLGGALNNVTEYDPQSIGTRKFWPIQRLNGLLLQFFVGPTCPPQSVLYNFNGMDNSLTLRVTCQEYKNVFIDDFCIEQMV